MHWIEKIISDLEKRGDERLVLSTGKTPSGYIHIGIGRELIYCSAFERLLRALDRKTGFVLFIDSMDPIKRFPSYIPSDFTKYVGMPMFMIPCPEGCCESYALHFGSLFIKNLGPFGLKPKIVWTHELYQTGKMQDLVRKALRNIVIIRQILIDIVGSTLSPDQLEQYRERVKVQIPCQVICGGCGKMTRVTSFDLDEDTVSYSCHSCGEEGKVPISEGRAKLTWRVDWPAKWALFRVSCEPAGKDHCVRGGAYDTGVEICRRVFGWKGPYRVPFEWFLLGKRAMKTHRGISFTWDEWLSVAPPEILRFLVLRQSPRKHISFQPERLPQLIDEFEIFEAVYYGGEGATEAELKRAQLLYPLCMPDGASKDPPIRLPYRFATILSQITPLLGERAVFEKAVASVSKTYGLERLSRSARDEIRRSIERAKYWVTHYAPISMRIEIPERVTEEIKSELSDEKKEGLRVILAELQEREEWEEQELQNLIFEVANGIGLEPAALFEALYLVLLGRTSGPRLAPFLLSLRREFVLRRLKEALT